MRLTLIPLLLVLTSSSACSLINAYDDVVGATGAGGSGAGNPEGGAGAGPSTGGGQTGGAGGSGGDGGNGGMPPVLDCVVSGIPFLVEDLQAETGQFRTYRQNSFGYQPNGDQLRVFLGQGDKLRALEINLDSQSLQGPPYQTEAEDVSWGRPLGDQNHFGVMVVKHAVASVYPIDLLEFNNTTNLSSPVVHPISTGALTTGTTNAPRGRFVHVGPQPDNVVLAFETYVAGGSRVLFARHPSGGAVSSGTYIGGTFVGGETSKPQAMVRQADGTVHAFLGSPTMAGDGGTKHYIFDETDAVIPDNPLDLGPPGVIVVDAVTLPNGNTNMAVGQIAGASLKLLGKQIPGSGLGTIDTANFNTILELNSLLDVPNTGGGGLQGDTAVLFGASATKDKLVLIAGAIGGGTVVYKEDLLQPSSGEAFSDVAVFVSQNPITQLGGLARLIYSERHGSGPTAFDSLHVATLACEPQ